MTTFEVGVKGTEVVLILSVTDDDGGIGAVGVSMVPDDAKALCNAVGGAIRELAEEAWAHE